MALQNPDPDPNSALVTLDEAKDSIFLHILQEFPQHGAFNNKTASTVFVVYAHDNFHLPAVANAWCAQQLIKWLEKTSAKVLSDRSPSPLWPIREGGDAAGRNIIDNQLCLLPVRRCSQSSHRVDKVILCGSPLLESYVDHSSTAHYIDAITSAYGADDTENDETRESRIRQVVERECKNPNFHHVLTELAFLKIRCSILGNDHTIIPVSLNGDGNDLRYLSFLQNSNIRLKSNPDKPSLRMVFFKVLERLYHEELSFITDSRDCYREAIKSVDQALCLSKTAVEEISRNAIGKIVEERIRRIRAASQYERHNKDKRIDHSQLNDCLKSLYFPELNDRTHEIDTAVRGTCRWLFQHEQYRRWAASRRGLLWIKGHPGTGKSTLLRYAVNDDNVLPGTLVLFVFFHGRGKPLQKTPLGLFRSLLYQLGNMAPSSLRDVVQSFNERRDKQGAPEINWHWGLRELKDFFKSSLQIALQTHHVRVFVDALDESGDTDAVKVFQDLKALVEELKPTPMHLHICLSSRHYPILNKACPFEIYIEKEKHEDIVKYVQSRLCDTPISGLAASIAVRAKGSFIWSRLVIDLILRLNDEGEELYRIEEQITFVPLDLAQAYRKLMENPDEETVSLIRWITFSLRPLSLIEMRWALLADVGLDGKPPAQSLKEYQQKESTHDASDFDAERMKRRVQKLSRGLAEVSSDTYKVQFIHQSVQDFFFENRPDSENLGMKWEGEAHYRLSRACIRYFRLPKVSNEVNSGPLFLEQDLDLHFPLLLYAMRFWGTHARQSEQRGVCQKDILDSEYFNWPSDAFVRLLAPPFQDFHSWASEEMMMLHMVSKWSLIGPLKLLLKNENQAKIDRDARDAYGRSSLSYAAGEGHIDVVKVLLHANANIDSADVNSRTPLWWAANMGHTNVLQILLDGGAKVDTVDEHGQTPLSRAACKGYSETVRLILDCGVNTDTRDTFGQTPLLLAADRGHLEVVRLLLDWGVKIDAADEDNQTPLLLAAKRGHLKIVRLLLGWGAKVNIADKDDQTPLFLAAGKGQSEIVQLLLDWDANIDAADEGGQTPLWRAAGKGHSEIVRLLLDWGANIDATDDWGQTPLWRAASKGHSETVRLLLDRGAKIDAADMDSQTPLWQAAFMEHTGIMQILLDGGAKVDATDKDGQTPLWQAAFMGRIEIVQILLDWGAKVDTADKYGHTLLQEAADIGYTEIVRILLDRGAKVDAVNNYGHTLLQQAARIGHTEIVRILVDRGAKVDAADAYGRTPLLQAAFIGDTEIVKILLDQGAKVDATDKDGYTPLSRAALMEHTGIMQILLDRGAKVDAVDKYGHTLLQQAARIGHTEIVRLLIYWGANVDATDKYKNSALWYAAKKGKMNVVRLLLEKGAKFYPDQHSSSIIASIQNGYISDEDRDTIIKLLRDRRHHLDHDYHLRKRRKAA